MFFFNANKQDISQEIAPTSEHCNHLHKSTWQQLKLEILTILLRNSILNESRPTLLNYSALKYLAKATSYQKGRK